MCMYTQYTHRLYNNDSIRVYNGLDVEIEKALNTYVRRMRESSCSSASELDPPLMFVPELIKPDTC